MTKTTCEITMFINELCHIQYDGGFISMDPCTYAEYYQRCLLLQILKMETFLLPEEDQLISLCLNQLTYYMKESNNA